jgi:hypothetical protein
MMTLVTFLEHLIVSGAVVYAVYCLIGIIAYCALWSVRKLSSNPRRLAINRTQTRTVTLRLHRDIGGADPSA